MSDVHGDVAAMFAPDAAAGGLAGSASYSPFGTAAVTGSMPGLGYQGDYTDPATGLVEMGARWYDPATGSFVSSDTIGGTPVPSTVDGNPYAYADGNPLTNTDPTGHWGVGGGSLTLPEVLESGADAADLPGLYFDLFSVSFSTAYALTPSRSSAPSDAPLSILQQMAEDAVSYQDEYDWALGQMGQSSVSMVDPAADAAGSLPPSSSPAPCEVSCYSPPPPPKLPDCFAAGRCGVTSPPKMLKYHYRDTKPVINNKTLKQLCSEDLCVNPNGTGPVQGLIQGLDTPDDNTTNAGDDSDSTTITQQILKDIGIPDEPEAQPQPAADGASSGSGSGSACLPGAATGSAPTSQGNAIDLSTKGRTAAETAAIREYASRTNAWLATNGPATIQSTAGELRVEASAAARAERLRASRAGTSYSGQAGHVPDTAVTGLPNPPAGWLDMPGRSNQACGGVLGSRIGQTVTGFTVDGTVP
jgi:RHS repeat-associated protein